MFRTHSINQRATSKAVLADNLGSGFSFSLPRRGYRIQLKELTPELVVALSKQNKTSLPLLEGSSSLNETIAFVDVDYLPTWCKSFDTLASMLEGFVSDSGIVFRTPSKKVKVLYRFQGIQSNEAVKSYLKKIYSSCLGNLWNETVTLGTGEVKSCIDKGPVAISKCFINLDALKAIQAKWNRIETVILREIKKSDAILPEAIKKSEWSVFKGSLPEDVFGSLTPVAKKVLKMYCNNRKMLTSGVDMPVTFIANTLNVDVSTVTKARIELVNANIISEVYHCDRTKAGRVLNKKRGVWFTRASAYKLISEAARYFKSQVHKVSGVKDDVLKGLTSILDGEWHSKLFSIAYACCGSSEAFWTHLNRIQGIEDNGRRDKAAKIWDWIYA